MNFKWLGPVALLAAIYIGDQIRINRPGHKYRLTVEVETPEGANRRPASWRSIPTAATAAAARPAPWAMPSTSISAAAKIWSRCWRISTRTLELDGINYVALRAYTAAAGGKRVSFNEMNRQTGIVPVTGALIPVLVTFADPANPGTARNVQPDDAEAVLGKGYRLHGISAEAVPNGFWPLDFGGVLGEPVTRGIQAKLPWLNGADNAAAAALRAAGLPGVEAIDARETFTRK